MANFASWQNHAGCRAVVQRQKKVIKMSDLRCDTIFTSGTVILTQDDRTLGDLQEWPTEQALRKFKNDVTSDGCQKVLFDENVQCGCFPSLGANKIAHNANNEDVRGKDDTKDAVDWTILRKDVASNIISKGIVSKVDTSKKCRHINLWLQREQFVWKHAESMRKQISDISDLFLELTKETGAWLSSKSEDKCSNTPAAKNEYDDTGENLTAKTRVVASSACSSAQNILKYVEVICFLDRWSKEDVCVEATQPPKDDSNTNQLEKNEKNHAGLKPQNAMDWSKFSIDDEKSFEINPLNLFCAIISCDRALQKMAEQIVKEQTSSNLERKDVDFGEFLSRIENQQELMSRMLSKCTENFIFYTSKSESRHETTESKIEKANEEDPGYTTFDRKSLLRSVLSQVSLSKFVENVKLFTSLSFEARGGRNGKDPGGHLLGASLACIEDKLSELALAFARLLKLEEELFNYLNKRYVDWKARNKGGDISDPAQDGPFPAGPVGDSPVHTVILKKLKDTGKRMLERYYSDSGTDPDGRENCISVAYLNDLDPWRKTTNQRQNQGRDDGLYTGETCLHMAIVQEDEELVQYLLDHGIRLCSRARGVFFQPAHIRYSIRNLFSHFLSAQSQAEVNGGYLKLFFGWLRIQLSNRVKRGELALLHHVQNPRSGCYYGEFPLSFAASIGNVRICKQLYNKQKKMLPDWKNTECSEDAQEHFEQLRLRRTWLMYVPSDQQKRMTREMKETLFLNAMDSFGNTAMHMAVMYEKKDVIDWLMGQESAKQSLEILNHEGLTPLTLAARLGHVDIFNHILREHLSVVVWRYGKVVFLVCLSHAHTSIAGMLHSLEY